MIPQEEKAKLHLANLREDCYIFHKSLQQLLHNIKPIRELNWYLLCLMKLRNYQRNDKRYLSELKTKELTPQNLEHIKCLEELIAGRKLVFKRYENILRTYHESNNKS